VIEIRLDGDPVAKGRHRHRLDVKINPSTGKSAPFVYSHPDARTARFEDRLAWAAQVAMAGRPLLDGALRLDFRSFLAIPTSWSAKKRTAALRGDIYPTGRPDWDNFAKVIDALNGVVWRDDALVVDAHVRKRYSDRPRTEIAVEPMPSDGWQQHNNLL
jgi:Holliday junction resolvase RusA-like endonuclease